MIDNPIAKIPISGSITYMIEYEDDFKGYWAGNGPAYYTGVYAIGERIFTYKDGVLSFGTGGSKEFEDYESIAKDTTTSKDSIIKSINEVDLSYNDVGKKYLLTDTGEVYLATFTNKSDLKESDIQYKKLEDIKDKVVDIKLLHTGHAIVICTLSDGTELYIHELNGEYKGAYKYYPFINGYNYADNRHTELNEYGLVVTTQGISFYEDKVSVWYEDLTDRDISHGTGMEKPHVIFNIEGTYDVSGDIVTFKFDKCICKEPEAKEYSINGEVQLRYDGHSFEVVKWTKDPEEELLDYNEVLRKSYVYDFVTT